MRAPQTSSTRGTRRPAPRRLIAPAFLAALIAPTVGSGQEPVRRPLTFEQGLGADERRDFYHLSIGGEIFPVSWTRSLTSVATRRPFLQGLDRFGFLDDPDRPGGLPIGLTATKPDGPKSTKPAGSTPMLGLNCSACHVAELVHHGRAYRVDGAPNVLMDFIAFNRELSLSVKRVAEHPGDFAAFQLRVVRTPEEAERLKAIRPDVLKVLQALAAWDEKDGAHQMADALAVALRPLFHPGKSAWPLAGDLVVLPPLAQPVTLEFATPLQAIGEEAGPALGAFLKANSGEGSPLGTLAPDPLSAVAKIETLTEQLVEHFVQTLWYLKQSSALMAKQDKLRNGPGDTAAGPGRVDDFRLARSLILSNLLLTRPATSPTSFPVLWGTDRVKWLGWDGNADSTLQRNIATSIALGGVFDPESGSSSISLPDIYRLEVIGSKVGPPTWPFGSVDAEKAGRGAKLYANLCASCHIDPANAPFAPGGTLPDWLPDWLYDPAPAPGGAAGAPSDPSKFVGTDPNRAMNFVFDMQKMPGAPRLDEGLAIFQKLLIIEGNFTPWQARRLQGDRTETWRPTGKYAVRPLTATWAAAPYLHNDSVPTLYHLLLPASRRPTTFRRGGREYDSVMVGYREAAPGQPAFVFDTRVSGNLNIGHEYGTDLAEGDRMDLLEYLKTK